MTNQLLKPEKLEQLMQLLVPFNRALGPLNTKGGKRNATKIEMKAAVKCFLEPNSKLDRLMDSAYITGCNLLTLATQYKVTKTLLQNPHEYASLVQATEVSDAEFKKVKSMKAMKEFLLSSCCGNVLSPPPIKQRHKRSLAEAFDSSDDEPSKRKTGPVESHNISPHFNCPDDQPPARLSSSDSDDDNSKEIRVKLPITSYTSSSESDDDACGESMTQSNNQTRTEKEKKGLALIAEDEDDTDSKGTATAGKTKHSQQPATSSSHNEPRKPTNKDNQSKKDKNLAPKVKKNEEKHSQDNTAQIKKSEPKDKKGKEKEKTKPKKNT